MLDGSRFKRELTEIIRLSEDYLDLPAPKEHLHPTKVLRAQVDARNEEIKAQQAIIYGVIGSAVQARLGLLRYVFSHESEDYHQASLGFGREMLEQAGLSERQRMILEYELSFVGVNLIARQTFTPTVELFLTDRTYWEKARRTIGYEFEGDVGWYEHLIEDMVKYEQPRWLYSRNGKYSEEADLSNHIWGGEGAYEDLREELTEFLDGKKRILEVGFLHQRVHDVIKDIDPSIEYCGVDISLPAVQIARRKGISAFQSNAWYSIPYPDNHFDGVICVTTKAAGLHPNLEMERVVKDQSNILNFDLQ
ncbi:class I SAM-dependent methyltransferase [Candidatus Woesearchaeota archaeon]|nr:class I SAM-dependent methyltransferase [Candidatus Woesearchaeota archaeon]